MAEVRKRESIRMSVFHEIAKGYFAKWAAKSTCEMTNLLVFLETVTDYIDKGYTVDALYLDFQNTFDEVPHCRLIVKLKALGIDGKIASWIESWLNGTQQRVIIKAVAIRPATSNANLCRLSIRHYCQTDSLHNLPSGSSAGRIAA